MSKSSDDLGRAIAAILSARENIGLIRTWAENKSLQALRSDTLVRHAIERAFIAIDATLRDVPADIIARHGLPSRAITGFRNALAHTYDDILDERVILTIREDLPALDRQPAEVLERMAGAARD